MQMGFSFIFIFFSIALFAQNDTTSYFNKTLSKNNFTIELGGKALLYSIGYERQVFTSKKILLIGNVGLSYEKFLFDEFDILMPLEAKILIGEKRNKLSLGFTVVPAFNFNPYPKNRKERLESIAVGNYHRSLYSLAYMQPIIGVRRYFKNGNSFSITFNPIIFISLDETGKFNYTSPIIPILGINYNLKLC
jgi:hypothetical protein